MIKALDEALGIALAVIVLSFGVYLMCVLGVGHLNPIKAFSKAKSSTKASHSSLLTALGGTIGAGNIIGVAGAVAYGGAGAVLWLVAGAFIGMTVKMCEVSLALKTRRRLADGSYRGGAMYSTDNKPLAVFFCISCLLCAFSLGNITQSRAILDAINANPTFERVAVLLLCGLITSLSLGKKEYFTVSRMSKILVPLMGAIYLGLALVVILSNADRIVPSTKRIIADAFSSKNGVLLPLSYGITRGILSNEAGLGSSPIVHSTTNGNINSTDHAYIGVVEVFFSTIVTGVLTSYAILCTQHRVESAPIEEMTSSAFASCLGVYGAAAVRLSIVLFALTSIMSWFYYGACSVEYISDYSAKMKKMYKLAWCMAIPFSTLLKTDTSLAMADISCFFMCISNLAIMLKERRIFLENRI